MCSQGDLSRPPQEPQPVQFFIRELRDMEQVHLHMPLYTASSNAVATLHERWEK